MMKVLLGGRRCLERKTKKIRKCTLQNTLVDRSYCVGTKSGVTLLTSLHCVRNVNYKSKIVYFDAIVLMSETTEYDHVEVCIGKWMGQEKSVRRTYGKL